jgi:demethylmenaquinone methyltransferase/2-methoxy-6-polyprenyl-1,4-benzoquinol methylase
MANNLYIPEKQNKPDVESMFDSIAWRYDFLNHLLSFGIDRRWRRKAVGIIPVDFINPRIIDVATGTGDLAIEAVRLNPQKIVGIDISDNMLEKGRKKIAALNLVNRIELIKCDSMKICFKDNTFDIAMVAFGVRNFKDTAVGLAEMKRVLRDRGLIVILEFSKPEGFVFKHLYNFYFRNLLPVTGALFSKHKIAYRYLNESVMSFAESDRFIRIMTDIGFSDVKQKRLTHGIATIYTGVKK